MFLKNLFGGKPIVPGSILFDAHCHVFNLEYLVPEIGQIIYDMADGRYPGMVPDLGLEGALPDESLRSSSKQEESLLAWLLQIQAAALRPEAANALFIRSAAQTSWKTRGISLIPLMMDVYYLFAPPMPADLGFEEWKLAAETTVVRETGSSGSPVKEEDRNANPIVALAHAKEALEQARQRARSRVAHAFDEASRELESKGMDSSGVRNLKLALEELSEKAEEAKISRKAKESPGFKETAGFMRQFKGIQKLGKKGSGIYPFFAVDPRREGAVEWVINSGLVGRAGPFYGVKLYPRLGYHPACPALDPLYDFCQREAIPITTHASREGFPDWMMDHADFGYPGNFRPILDKYPDLKLDLAHFGDRSPDQSWADEISRMIRAYRNVYSDLSCHTHASTVEYWRDNYRNLLHVRDRTMFGSDFDVMYFTNPGLTLEEYYQSFLDIVGAKDLGWMASTVPRSFLGL